MGRNARARVSVVQYRALAAPVRGKERPDAPRWPCSRRTGVFRELAEAIQAPSATLSGATDLEVTDRRNAVPKRRALLRRAQKVPDPAPDRARRSDPESSLPARGTPGPRNGPEEPRTRGGELPPCTEHTPGPRTLQSRKVEQAAHSHASLRGRHGADKGPSCRHGASWASRGAVRSHALHNRLHIAVKTRQVWTPGHLGHLPDGYSNIVRFLTRSRSIFEQVVDCQLPETLRGVPVSRSASVVTM